MKLYAYILITLMAATCTPPQGWKSYGLKRSLRPGSYKIVRVMIHKGGGVPVYAPSSYTFRVEDAASRRGRGKFIPRASGEFIPAKGFFKLGKKVYPGRLVIHKKKNKYTYVNLVPLGEYLVSVVGHEMNPGWNPEALKAQAVVARTYVADKMRTAGRKSYDLDATTKSQVYGGMVKNDARLKRVVEETRGKIVTYGSKLAPVFFYSSCGGRTASSEEVWKSKLPYLKSIKSHYCEKSPAYRWTLKVSRKVMERALGRKGIKSISISKRSPSKRASEFRIVYAGGVKHMKSGDFRRRLGARNIKSTLLGIRSKGGSFEIAGKGYGHGVGLCQWGTRIMADKHSKKYSQILRHFFPGTRIGKLNPGILI